MSSDEAKDAVSFPLPKGVTVAAAGGVLTVKSGKKTLTRPYPDGALDVSSRDGALTLKLRIPANRKRAKALLHTWEAHARNLVVGVSGGFTAKMKVVAAHFPMKVAVKDDRLVIENFLGEKFPRSAPLRPGVAARVEGEFVILEGPDIEQVGQSSANIERATRIRDYDPRVFQDGIYIVERAHPSAEAA
jgi:large subunit ribosomal protein L6